MEINSKQLHLHAMPVALLLVGIVSLVAVSINQPANYDKALFTSAFQIEHKPNGLTSLSLKNSQPNTLGNSGSDEVGQTAQRYLLFNSK